MSEEHTVPASALRVKPRRRSRWVWRFAGSMFVTLLLVIGWRLVEREWTRRSGERELAEVQAAVEASDPDWTWERLNAKRKRPPEGKNGAELIPRIKKLTHADWGKELAKDEWQPRLEVPPNVRYSPAVLAEVRHDLLASAEAVKLARTLKDYPEGNRQIELLPNTYDTRLEDTANTRHVADLLRWDVVIAVEDGDAARAVADLAAILNTSRSLGDEPFLISQVIRIAIRIITVRQAEWVIAHAASPPELAGLQAALADDAEEPLLLYGFCGERAILDRLFANLDSGAASSNLDGSRAEPSTLERLGWWHFRANLPADRAFALNWMSLCVDAARLPLHEQQAAFATLPPLVKDQKRIISGLFLPAAEKVAHAYWRSVAELRCAVAGIACERFRQKHGRWPNELAELVPAFLPAVPLDPYSGQPLQHAKLEEGVVVYSVGKKPPPGLNIIAPAPVQAAAPVTTGLPEGIDIGFRLYNPDRRRQPAPPDPDPAPPEGEQDP